MDQVSVLIYNVIERHLNALVHLTNSVDRAHYHLVHVPLNQDSRLRG